MTPTKIEWAEETWNPTTGCTRVSPGCDNCYAFKLHDQRYAAKRRGAKLPPQYDLPFSKVQLSPQRLDKPLRWKKPRRVFVDSMADLFHEDVPDDYLDRVFAVMALASQHQFLILTKRPERMREYIRASWRREHIGKAVAGVLHGGHRGFPSEWRLPAWPLPNVWLGVSAEDQQRADERIPVLLDTPAAVRFVSAEPLLGPIDFRPRLGTVCSYCAERAADVQWARMGSSYQDGHVIPGPVPDACGPMVPEPETPVEPPPHLNWLIVGGESGPRARPMDLAWARSIVEQCRAASVPVFVKQLGARVLGPDRPTSVRRWILQDEDGRTGDWYPPVIGLHAGVRPDNAIGWVPGDAKGGRMSEWPEDLRVREFPR